MARMTRLKLSIMMFLMFFIWGAWWVTLGAYMTKLEFGDIIGRTYGTQGLAAILSPLFVGMIADRYFSAQKVMGVLHLMGAVLLAFLTTITSDKTLFYFVTLGYMLTFMPTLALSNAIAFTAMTDSVKQFPAIRVLGTIGWIVAGLSLSFVVTKIVLPTGSVLTIEQTNWPIRLAAGAAVILGLFSFALPDTPPTMKGEPMPGIAGLLGLDILKHVKTNAFWVFIIASLLVCIPLTFYYSYTNTFLVEKGTPNAVALQSLGQMSEIFFMLLLPFFLIRFGFKYVLLIGMLCWVLRYIFFAFGYEGSEIVMAMAIGGIVLHGLCYDLFFVAGQIYIDKSMPLETRARAQSFLTLVTLGVGSLLGGELANLIVNINTNGGVIDWKTVWTIPAILAFVIAIGFAVTFHDKNTIAK